MVAVGGTDIPAGLDGSCFFKNFIAWTFFSAFPLGLSNTSYETTKYTITKMDLSLYEIFTPRKEYDFKFPTEETLTLSRYDQKVQLRTNSRF